MNFFEIERDELQISANYTVSCKSRLGAWLGSMSHPAVHHDKKGRKFQNGKRIK